MSSTPTPPSSQPSTSGSATPRSFSPFNRKRPLPKSPPPPPVQESLEGISELSGLSSGSGVASNHHASSSNSQPLLMVTSSPASTVMPLQGSASPRPHSRSPEPNDGSWRKKINDILGSPRSTAGSDLSTSWWEKPEASKKRKYSTEEQIARNHTKKRVAIAVKSILGTTADVTHELLDLGSDFLEFAPIPGLAPAARALLQIWDALGNVDVNALSCVRLTERCAETLIAVRQEIHEAGDMVTEELCLPLERLQEAFDRVRRLMVKESARPFIKRYLKRDDMMKEIADSDTDVREALDVFNVSVSIRILKQSKESELQRQAENRELLAAIQQGQQNAGNALMLTGVSGPVASSPPQIPQQPVISPPPVLSDHMSAEQLKSSITQLQSVQDVTDRAQDAESLRQLIRLALQTTNDAEMLELFQIKRQEMPDAIKTLQRALERVIEHERQEAQSSPAENRPPTSRRMSMKELAFGRSPPRGRTIDSWSSSSGSLGSAVEKDTLHREFLECGIDTLRRMSRDVETDLPSWTITRFEVDRDQKIGVGFFSDVYKGTWRGHTVAVKLLADTTPRELFSREVTIWKTLKHPNVLELFGASSTCGDPPWFFVSPYLKNGSLGEFLRRIHGSMFGDIGKLSPQHATSSLPSSGTPKTGRQATFPLWPGVNSPSQPTSIKVRSPTGDPKDLRSRDLHRFIYEIAKGMAYLHSQNVHHGDLKAANVLVDDKLHCVISDFGQSEMKTEAFNISGAMPPHGTLRWQAPELMRGSSHLTKEMDIYSFAICCVEVLNWGNIPWAHIDDLVIRHLILDENERPAFPAGSAYAVPALKDLITACWDRDPTKRPPFSKAVIDMKTIRSSVEITVEDNSGHGSPLPGSLPEIDTINLSRSPDLRPLSPLESDDGQPELPDFSDEYPHTEHSVPTPDIRFPEPLLFTPTVSRRTSISESASIQSEPSIMSPYQSRFDDPASPPPESDIQAQIRNERKYRLLLTHEYHPSLSLPVWEPTPVDLGAIGYLSKPRGAFITLFNAFQPYKSSLEVIRGLSSIEGYGRVNTGSERKSRKTNLFDTVMGLLSKVKGDGTFPQAVCRRYTYPLKAGHKAAILCADTTEYRYMHSEHGEQLDAPKRWFKANADIILKTFGAQHHIQREDLFLIVGTLRTPNYALFVSHNHPEGHAHFNVFLSPKNGQPWGVFTTDSKYDGSGPPIDAPEETSRQSASKVSSHGGAWEAILLSRLRFKPDSTEPTTL